MRIRVTQLIKDPDDPRGIGFWELQGKVFDAEPDDQPMAAEGDVVIRLDELGDDDPLTILAGEYEVLDP